MKCSRNDELSPYYRTFSTYKSLGGNNVGLADIQTELSQWQLDGVLGFLSAVSSEALQFGPAFYEPEHQGRYLELALIDDFPEPLPGLAKRIVPGFAPNVNGHKPMVHTQNLAWLTHQAILYCKRDGVTPNLERALQERVARLLLIANDHLTTGETKLETLNLRERRRVALDVLRRWQFSQSFDIDDATRSLLRQRTIFLDILPKYFDVREAFARVTNGISLDVYFAVLMMIRFHLFTAQLEQATGNKIEMGLRSHGFKKSSFFSQFEASREQAETILSWWTTDAENYAKQYQAWKKAKPDGELSFDYVQLRVAPLIEVRPDDLFFPISHFLLQKVIDEPYFLLAQNLKGSEKTHFFTGIGAAYEDYANDLIKTIADKDTQGVWSFIRSPKANEGTLEISDGLLFRDGVAIVFEHKALRPDTNFLLGGGGDRILGPPDDVLEQLEKQKLNADDTKKTNKGLISRVMNQQTLSAPHLSRYVEDKLSNNLKKAYPLTTHLADLHVDQFVYKGYLELLIERNNFYFEDFWQPPQWLHVGDLELLANLAEEGRLDFEELLIEKNRVFQYLRFDEYLANVINAQQRRPNDYRTRDRLHAATREAKRLLFPTSSVEKPKML